VPSTALTVRNITLSGLTPAAEVAFDTANGMNLPNNNGKTSWIEVTNTHATNTMTLTVVTPGTVGGRAVADDSYSIPAGPTTKRRYGPFPVSVYGETVEFTATGTGTLTIAAYQLVA
jgi:hypothetical protein